MGIYLNKRIPGRLPASTGVHIHVIARLVGRVAQVDQVRRRLQTGRGGA